MRATQQRRRHSVYAQQGQARRHKPDYIITLISIVLLLIGLVVIYSISPGLAAQKHVSDNYYVSKQLIAILLGIFGFAVTAAVPLSFWRSIKKPLLVIATVSAFAVRLFGEKVNGAYRWIQIGGVSFQAVELIKFALIIWLASFLLERISTHQLTDLNKTFKPLLIVLGIIGLVVAKIQSDLGSTAVIVCIMVAMCYVAGMPLKKVLMFGGIVAIGAVLAVSTTAYRRDRLFTFLHPERDCQNTGYQACQALIAVGSGGLFGKGLAHSVQAYGYLPEAANDSIFAIYAEKFGFVGVTSLLCLCMVFFWRIKNIMERAPDDFSRLVVAGILAWLSTQMIINIGAMVGLLPLKGITLPFISYGGTSIMFVTAAVGLVFNISRYTTYGVGSISNREGRAYEGATYRGRDRRTHYSAISRRP